MRYTDEQLLDFDKGSLMNEWDEEKASAALSGENAETYRNHLALAKAFEGWAEKQQAISAPGGPDPRSEGFIRGLEEVAAHLRQGDLLPGGVLYQTWLA